MNKQSITNKGKGCAETMSGGYDGVITIMAAIDFPFAFAAV
jgi:hypothetical protein